MKHPSTVGGRIYQLEQEILELEAVKNYPGISDDTPIVQIIHPKITSIFMDMPKQPSRFYTVCTMHHISGTDEYLKEQDIRTTETRTLLIQ
jgi:hypothetical protein